MKVCFAQGQLSGEFRQHSQTHKAKCDPAAHLCSYSVYGYE